MTTTIKLMVVLAAVALGGCGEEGTAANGPDADDGTGGVGGTLVGAGGQAGSASSTGGQPVGGAPALMSNAYGVAVSAEIGFQFTRADHDMCMAWPVCPPDVFSVLTNTGRVASQQCTLAFDGGRLACGGCLRRSTCEHFVGRCIAPYLMAGNTDGFYVAAIDEKACRSIVDANIQVAGKWVLCTGDTASYTDANGVPVLETFDFSVRAGVNANTVCKD